MILRIRDAANQIWTAPSAASNFEDARTRALLDGVVTRENNEFIPPNAIVGIAVVEEVHA
jgi:hypothetical protein